MQTGIEIEDPSQQLMGHWTFANMRLFMEEFAKKQEMDPLHPDSWYHSYEALVHSKVGAKLVSPKKEKKETKE
jgi:hypothetical protein